MLHMVVVGGVKSRSFATMAAVRGYIWGHKVDRDKYLCPEYMNSLAESSFTEIEGAIPSA